MWNGNLVIDAVGHTYDFRDDNRRSGISPNVFNGFIDWLYGYGHTPLESTEPGYLLSPTEFRGGWTTEELTEIFFRESDVDVVAMHAVNFFDLFERGANPWPQVVEFKRAAPQRVLLYAAVDPLGDRGMEMERMAARADDADGFKFYPVNGLRDARRQPLSYSFGDERIFPFFEQARKLGIKHIAIHKGVPTARGPHDQDRPDDVAIAAAAFPDMTFEVVHSGWAFLEDCAYQLQLNPNIYANLETTANAAVRMPRRFARAVGELLAAAPKQVMFASGAPLSHPQPVIEAIASMQMPQDLVDEGLPELTDAVKADLFGGTMARLHGLDVEKLSKELPADEFSRMRADYADTPEPWRAKRARIRAELGVA
ncbi:amidohydrolase family protein [Herbiconiux sp. P17]|uniref:amidohydrolase family protein n=1 Tax=Herbiconiux wuyangfengii TaxID=3342794 RepID=UPI0035B7F877